MYTSLELSKKLKENGCKLESNMNYLECESKGLLNEKTKRFPKYDILNDICVKYAKEFFGENEYIINEANKTVIDYIFSHVRLWKIKEAEEYIREHCLYNPKNKWKNV